MKESIFTLESMPTMEFDGFTKGETWNGWACPLFNFEQSQKIVEAHNNQELLDAFYDEIRDVFVFEFPDEPEEYFGEMIDGEKFYDLGSGVWIWEEK